jgi:chromosome partitioning protein
MNTTLVLNPKGGSGKTTIALNLASYFASVNVPTTVMDYDPQGSSLNWLRVRPAHANKIHGVSGARQKGTKLRSVAMHVPPESRQLIIDAPAGASGTVLQEMLDRASCIVLPVTPSCIDLHATYNFTREVLQSPRMRSRNVPLAVVANKVRRSMPRYQPLDWFLDELGLTLTARLIDSDVYLKAVEAGCGIFEMPSTLSAAECQQFLPLAEWVQGQGQGPGRAPRTDRNVYELARGAQR